MHRVQRTEKLSSVPLPADYFDLMCGTSTGGLVVTPFKYANYSRSNLQSRLIALLLGCLRLSVPEVIVEYRVLAKQVFSERKARAKDGAFKASNLEKAIEDVVERKLGPGHADERMFMTGEGCKT